MAQEPGCIGSASAVLYAIGANAARRNLGSNAYTSRRHDVAKTHEENLVPGDKGSTRRRIATFDVPAVFGVLDG
jgi:hypothetical protein